MWTFLQRLFSHITWICQYILPLTGSSGHCFFYSPSQNSRNKMLQDMDAIISVTLLNPKSQNLIISQTGNSLRGSSASKVSLSLIHFLKISNNGDPTASLV